MKKLWSMHYRPQTIEDFSFADDQIKSTIQEFIKTKSIPHLLLKGKPGRGKTSLAYLLKNELNVDDTDFLKFNASDDTSVEIVRGAIKNFISIFPVGEFKIVLLDEADRLSAHAFDALKNYMEEYADNARFILTCNNEHRIDEAIRSRCIQMDFTGMNSDELTIKCVKILKAEGIKIPSLDILDTYVQKCDGDCRILLNSLQKNSTTGILLPYTAADSHYEIKATAMIYMESGDWDAARSLLCGNLTDDDYLAMYRFVYENLNNLDKFKDLHKWKSGIKIIAEHLHRHNISADKEINFAACFIMLSEIK